MVDLVRYLIYHDGLLIDFFLKILVLKFEVFGDDLDLIQVFVLTFDMFSLGHYKISVLHAHVVFDLLIGQVRLALLDDSH